ncbi:homocysteine S-methyltransferase family protein [Sulfitobacter sabulilitoris]|uniref:Homocysteine S-methyltransferase family protein n=1 Tax=Sulfitobacter sabulilitoris TaxID=2562655 RepID=A0A5S3PE98_9RHOB|nr:homocysteine S-methyltransferase family protein [Sulfitobacter sabulilitoris]TMM52372.1 homocysteine S-methyltransferase family protein [Sulfitobacter sabulilitoris]
MTDITLLDGSIGQELVKRSGDPATPLWSTQVMIDHPALVAAVHADYFAAGATIASTNTYATYESRLEKVGLGDRVDELIATALDQAETARTAHGSGRIAGVIGPLLASYRPDLVVPPEDAAARFGARAARLVPRVDLLLAETVSSLNEAEGALRGGTGHGKPFWIAFTVEDHDGTRLRSGEPLSDVLALIAAYRPDAVLINCTRPEAIAAALPILAQSGLPFGAYANGFVEVSEEFKADMPTVDALQNRTDLTPAAYADMAMGWVGQGATIIGGCCEVGPDHIAEIARRLRRAGHAIV